MSERLTLAGQAHLVAPDLMNGAFICVQRECLGAELDGCIGGQQHERHIEQEVVHQRRARLHWSYSEEQQRQAHLCASFDGDSCICKML